MDKSIQIIEMLVELCNRGEIIIISPDEGGNSLRIRVSGYQHVHLSKPRYDLESLISHLHYYLESITNKKAIRGSVGK